MLDVVYYGQGETHLAVATNSHHIKVYHLETMNCTLLKGHTDLVLSLATSKADLDVLVTSSKVTNSSAKHASSVSVSGCIIDTID